MIILTVWRFGKREKQRPSSAKTRRRQASLTSISTILTTTYYCGKLERTGVVRTGHAERDQDLES